MLSVIDYGKFSGSPSAELWPMGAAIQLYQFKSCWNLQVPIGQQKAPDELISN